MSAETKSGEYSSNNAIIFNGNNGNLNNNNKYNSNSVRPVTDFRDNCYTFEEFYLSLRIALRVCYKNKRNTPNALRFRINEAENLLRLARAAYYCEYVPGKSIIFLLKYPCLREAIAADFPDRVIQTWLVMRIEPLFNRCGSIPDEMYSCRVGKGNLAALMAVRDAIYRLSCGYTQDCTVAKLECKVHYYNTVYASGHFSKMRHLEKFVSIINSYFGLMKHFASYNIRKRISDQIMQYWDGYLYFSDDLLKATIVRKYKDREIRKRKIRRRHRQITNILNTQYYGNNKQNQAA